ncbi:MAG TPA: hypothetical protein VGJ74_13690 [Burkholderiales bacterium]
MVRSLLAIGLAVQAFCAHAELGLNVYGLSYHFDRDKAREKGLTHEVNPGLGVRWRSNESMLFADAGFYRDSAAHTAKLAGAGAFWHASERLRLGGAAVLLKSETYNHGKAFIAPVPLAAYETRRATFNLVYFPKWRDVNPTSQVGAWVTFWLPN